MARLKEPTGKREGTDRRAEKFPGSEGPRATGGPGACWDPTARPVTSGGAAGTALAGAGEGCRGQAHLGASSSLRRGGEGAGECALCPAEGPADPRPGALWAGRCRRGLPVAAPSHRPALLGTGQAPRLAPPGGGERDGRGRRGREGRWRLRPGPLASHLLRAR